MLDPDSLRDFIETSGAEFRANAKSFIFDCPKCESKEKLYIRKWDGKFRCMKCGPDFNGWADYALSLILNRPRSEIRPILYGDVAPAGTDAFTVTLKDHWSEFDDEDFLFDDEKEDIQELVWSPDIFDLDASVSIKGNRYLSSRGITKDIAKHYGIRYSPSQRRVIFPVEASNQLVGWQGRYIDETEFVNEDGELISIPKMLTMGSIGGKYLMFEKRLNNSAHAVLTEGPFDALKAHLCGGNVATMGKGVTMQQIKRILDKGIRRIYIGLDPDAAEDIMRILREIAGMDVTCYRLDPPEGKKDLGDATMEEVLEAFEKAPVINSGHIFYHLK